MQPQRAGLTSLSLSLSSLSVTVSIFRARSLCESLCTHIVRMTHVQTRRRTHTNTYTRMYTHTHKLDACAS